MNILNPRHIVRNTLRSTLLVAAIFSALHLQAAGQPQPHRFLLIFETSPALKKNLKTVRQTLSQMFVSDLQEELHTGDDVAVWTVDDTLHTSGFPLTSWASENAAAYTVHLDEYLGEQKFTRHASLAPIEPLLNRIIQSSEHLTILIFCDSQSSLQGTPFDDAVNQVITNTAARTDGRPIPLVLVLRSYRGESVGSSVNQSAPLKFPPFPMPPKPAPPVAIKQVVITPATPAAPEPGEVSGPIMKPVPALIIVGTNAGTNISLLDNPPPAPPPSTSPPHPVIKETTAANTATPTTPAPAPVPTEAPSTPVTPLPTQTPPTQPAAPSAPMVVAKPSGAPSAVSQSNTVTVAAGTARSSTGYLFPLVVGVGALASALVILIRLLVRARRPRSSLITSSMFDDRRPPPPPQK